MARRPITGIRGPDRVGRRVHADPAYNPPNGGLADGWITGWIEKRANQFLAAGLADVSRLPFERAARATTTREHDFLNAYVADHLLRHRSGWRAGAVAGKTSERGQRGSTVAASSK